MQENNFESALCIHRHGQLYSSDVFSSSLHRLLCLFDCFFLLLFYLVSVPYACFPALFMVGLFAELCSSVFPHFSRQSCFPPLIPLVCFLRVTPQVYFPRFAGRLVFLNLAWLTCLPPFTALFSHSCNLFHDLHTWLGLCLINHTVQKDSRGVLGTSF